MNHILVFPHEAQYGQLPLGDMRAQHILKTLKILPNQCFRMGVLDQGKGIAKLCHTDTQYLYFTYYQEEKAEQSLAITLLIGATRPPVLLRILRDASAFGVRTFLITHTKNSEKSYLHSRIWQNEQYKNAIYEGLSIARCVTMPTVHRCFSLEESLHHISTACCLLADPSAKGRLSQLPCALPLTLAVGPERGFISDEINLLQAYGFKLGHLGKRIIRSETACFAALSTVCCAAGLF